MSQSEGILIGIGAAWFAIGLFLSLLMGRRGHSAAGWFTLGALMGPLGLALAYDARRHSEKMEPVQVAHHAALGDGSARRAEPGSGPVDVLVGYDGSPEAVAAVDAVVTVLGDRLGRLTAATVVPFGRIPIDEEIATRSLRSMPDRTRRSVRDMEILHGHPAESLTRRAGEGGYDLIVVGTRGTGLSNTLLGSVASELARGSKVPVLVVGGP